MREQCTSGFGGRWSGNRLRCFFQNEFYLRSVLTYLNCTAKTMSKLSRFGGRFPGNPRWLVIYTKIGYKLISRCRF